MNKWCFALGALSVIIVILWALFIKTMVDDHFRINHLEEKCKCLENHIDHQYSLISGLDSRLRATRLKVGLEKDNLIQGWNAVPGWYTATAE